MRLFLLFLIVPIIEIFLFIEVGGWIGTWPTIGIVILTAVVGSYLLRRQGLQALRDVQTRLSVGDSPGQLLAEGAMILLAGALLLTPGFFTDAVGLALLVPPVRAALYRAVKDRIQVVEVTTSSGAPRPGMRAGEQVVDGEYTDVTPEPGPSPGTGAKRAGDGPR